MGKVARTTSAKVSTSSSSLLGQLRAATRRDHHCLDQHPRLRRLLDRNLDRASYASALAGLHGAQSHMETRVRLGLDHLEIDGYRFEERTPALFDDLACFGGPPPTMRLQPMTVCGSLHTLLGWLYVLEGSRLGARPIAQRVRAILGPATPLRYFADAGGDTVWPRFCAFIECHGSLHHAEDTIAGARDAFSLFRHSLDASPPFETVSARRLPSLEGTK